MHSRRTILGWAATAAATGTVLSGCGATPAPAGPDTPASGSFPLTITHRFGRTTIPRPPTRIVALSFEEDLLSRIGLGTVGHADNIYQPGQPYPWQRGAIDLSASAPVVDPAGQVNLERLAALRPDLILATTYYSTQQVYPQLSAIAPTITFATAPSAAPWQETSTLIGRAVGREAAVAPVLARVDRYLSDLKARLPGLAGKSYSGGYYFQPGQFSISADPNGQSARVRAAVGLTLDPELRAAFPSGRGFLPIERIGLFDSDLLLIGFSTPELQRQLEANPLYRNLDVVRQGRTALVDPFGAAASNNPTALNVPWLYEAVRPVLEKVSAEA